MTDSPQLHSWKIHHKELNPEALRLSFLSNQEYVLGKDEYTASAYDQYLSLAYTVRERLVERWISTQQTYHDENLKRVYYLSMEFLIGRLMDTNMINLGIHDASEEAVQGVGLNLEDLSAQEIEAGLGNGGLGRLAACFLDSMATLGLPAHGYGIRYDYGIFRQRIHNGEQVEQPDEWMKLPNPWEFPRPESIFPVKFCGRTIVVPMPNGRWRTEWVETEDVLAMPYDYPIPGYKNDIVNTLRLWSARTSEEFSFSEFNQGDYMGAIEKKAMSENVSKVLYPNDNIYQGRELRLKQEYFLVSATLQDILRRFKNDNANLESIPEKMAIQMNDTHPALAIAELMRILVDLEGMVWEKAWEITQKTFAFTNHTLMPEALERWPVPLFEKLLPRHLEIIYEINRRFMREVSNAWPMDADRLRRMSIIEEGQTKKVRMAHLAIVGSHSVNGVAELHSCLLREEMFKDFSELWPERFNNKTNGVTQRRWMLKANAPLADLINDAIGTKWHTDLFELRHLEEMKDDEAFQKRWNEVKQINKRRLAEYIERSQEVMVNPESMFDSQVKRIHEYKRQLMFALWGVARYLTIKDNPSASVAPRTLIFAGKAAPGYFMAKLIIQFINSLAEVVNSDPQVNGRLNVFFLENYNVSLAELIMPGTEISEQISTAGMEASGTGNMKFALNGAITIGTLDGANIEIAQEVGEENIFIFGKTDNEIADLKASGYDPVDAISKSPELARTVELIRSGFFSPEDPTRYRPIIDSLTSWGDPFFITADFPSYFAAQERLSQAYQDRARWTAMSIINVARCGKFSSDRTIQEYNRDIWHAPMVNNPKRTRERAEAGKSEMLSRDPR